MPSRAKNSDRASGKKKDFRVNSALHPEYQQPGLHITMDSNGVNTNYSVHQNYVTIMTDLTKNCGITIGRIEGGKVAERREDSRGLNSSHRSVEIK